MTATPPPSERPIVALLVLALIATALAYLPGLDGPLLLDDRHNLAPLAAVSDGRLAAWDFVVGAGDDGFARPVSRLSFLVNWLVAGDDVKAFKNVNLALHLVCGWLVFALSRRLFARTGVEAGNADRAALFAAAAWLLAPMFVSTVLYTVQRMAQLAALFTLAGLLCYASGRACAVARPRRSALLVGASFAFFWPLAALSKENGALLPLLALLVELWFFPATRAARWQRWLAIACVAVPAIAALGRFALDPDWVLGGYAARDFGLGERLLTQARALFDYAANLLLIPGGTPMGLWHDDFAISRGPLTPWTGLASALVLAAIVLAAFLVRGGMFAPAGFGLLFFVAAHLLESSVFPLELYFEHRNYLPAFGLYFALASLAAHALDNPRLATPLTLLLVVVPLVYGASTIARAWTWGDEARLYRASAEAHPASARAQLALASVFLNEGEFDAGISTLSTAERLMGPEARFGVALQLLAAYCVHGRAVPESLYRRIEDAGVIGSDFHTINGIAWIAGALRAGRCTAVDAGRLHAAVRALPRAPGGEDAARAAARDRHLDSLLGR